MVDYLLGRLSEPERQALTEEFLDNDDVYRAILAMEEALIDAYARGELGDEDARLVESRLLQTEAGLAKLRTAQALARRQGRKELRDGRKWLAAAAVLVAACGIGLGVAYLRPHRAVRPASSAETAAAAIVLPLGAVRGDSGVPAVRIPAGGSALFAVALAGGGRSADYEVRIRTSEGKEVIRPGHEIGNFVRFDIDAGSLIPGRYEIEVSGVDPGGRRLIAFGPVDLRR